MRLVAALLLVACAPPPELPLATASQDPAIEILYPETEQMIPLSPGCVLDVPIVVHTEGIELTPPDPDNLVDGQGHWHGGPDLGTGYCVTHRNSCDDYRGEDVPLGVINLRVELQDNGHNPFEEFVGARDQVEVTIVNPPGEDCAE